MPWTVLAREFLRSLRGRRSQQAFSRRLGYDSNVVHAWEGGRRWPRASEVLRAATTVGVDVPQALRAFLATPWSTEDLGVDGVVARILTEARGGTPVSVLATRTGYSRFAVSRWLKGKTEPNLHQFFGLLEGGTGRLLDFVAGFVDPTTLPSVAAAWLALQHRRDIAWTVPWCHAILRGLELTSYLSLPRHRRGWLAQTLGIDPKLETSALDSLRTTGVISWDGTHYRTTGAPLVIDTTRSPDAGRSLKLHWARVATERLDRGDAGLFSYSVFAISKADLAHLRELHLRYFRALQGAISNSGPSETVVVANVQLFELGAPPDS